MPPQQGPPPPVFLIFIILFYMLNTPDQSASLGFGVVRETGEERVARYRHGVDVLNATRWQDFAPKSANSTPGETTRYLNLTGFRREDDFAWERLDAFKKRSEQFGADAKRNWRVGKDGKVGLQGMVYENATGIVKGKWVRFKDDLQGKQQNHYLNLTEISPGIDWAFYSPESWIRNITGDEGDMILTIDGNKRSPDKASTRGLGPMDYTRPVKARLTIQDETSSGDGWDISLHGVHWPHQGVMYMTTTSDKFAGIFGLPHLTVDGGYFETSQKLLNRTLETVVDRMKEQLWRVLSNPWSASPDDQSDATMPTPHCEFVVFVQVQPIKLDHSHDEYFEPSVIIEEIERELRFPNGAPIPSIPSLEMSTVIFSPDCGFIIESKGPPAYSPKEAYHLVGKKEEYWLQGIHKWLNVFAVVIFLQIMLLKKQSKEASTPSTIGRVSLYTMALILMADGLIFSSMSFLSVLVSFLFPSAFIVSFMGLISIGMGVRFCAAIYNVQEPERRARLQEQRVAREAAAAAVAPSAVVATAAGADVTTTRARAPTPPIIIPSDQDVDAEIAEVTSAATPMTLPTTNRPVTAQTEQTSQTFGAVYARFVLILTVILFISLSAHSWSRSWRNGYTNLMSFIYLSFWWPQIYRNVVRNCRKALLWKFVIGQSLLRLSPIAYFYLKKDNIIWAETDWKSFTVLAGWVWIQVWVLAGQEVLGPRWGLPKSWYIEGWDYHPVLREDNVEAGGLPIGLVQPPASPTLDRVRTGDDEFAVRKKKDSSMRVVDCAICMQVLEVPVIASGEEASSASVVGMLARRQYMVTPCRHIFHSACLEGWMKFRLQCPICRETLPPL